MTEQQIKAAILKAFTDGPDEAAGKDAMATVLAGALFNLQRIADAAQAIADAAAKANAQPS